MCDLAELDWAVEVDRVINAVLGLTEFRQSDLELHALSVAENTKTPSQFILNYD